MLFPTILGFNFIGIELLVLLIFGLLVGGLFLYTLIDVLRSEFKGQYDKLIWVLLIVFLFPLGSLLYLLMAGSQKTTDRPSSGMV